MKIRPEVTLYDLPALPANYRIEAVRVLHTLRDHPELLDIVELGKSHVGLDLGRFGACSVRFGGHHSGFRVVFLPPGLLPEEGGPEVIAVGNRCRSEVFLLAQERLCPREPVRHFRTHHMNHEVRRIA